MGNHNKPSKEHIMKSLQQGPFHNKNTVSKLSDPIADQAMIVTLDQLKTYEKNPRRTKNPLYAELKASIRARGLDHPPPITRRPGDNHYIIRNGGNTRLEILNELWAETRDKKFYQINCLFKPWSGEISALVGHLAENELHGELKFIEKALGVSEMKKLYEKELSESDISFRRLSELLKEDGYPISHAHIKRMLDCVEHLLPSIPDLLYAGLGRPRIEELITFKHNLQRIWEHYLQQDDEQFNSFWQNTLSAVSQNFETISEYAFDQVKDEFIGQLSSLTGEGYNTLQLDLLGAERGESLGKDQNTLTEEKLTPLLIEPRDNDINLNIGTDTEIDISEIAEANDQLSEVSDKYTDMDKNAISQDLSTSESYDFNDTDEQEIINQHIIEPTTTSPRVQNIQQQIEKQLGGEPVKFEETVLKAIPVQAGGGLAEITDIWHIAKHLDTKEDLRQELYGLAYDLACHGNCQDNLIKTNEGLGFGLNTQPVSEKNDYTESITLLLILLLRLHSGISTEHQPNMLTLISQLLLGNYDIAIGDNEPEAIGIERLPDVLLVKLFRFIRLTRRLVDLCK